jgi:hypothetical protein
MSRILSRGSAAQVFASTCTGLENLSRDIDRPLVLIDAALDPEHAVETLRERAHGGARRWADSFQPLLFEPGWSDWRLVPLGSQPGKDAMQLFGIEPAFGVVYVPLSGSVDFDGFRKQLRGCLRHLQLQAAIIRPAFLEERSDTLREVVVHPRYTVAHPQDFRAAELVEDIFVLDYRAYERLFWSIVAARAAAGEGSEPLWR